jgi:hypothetical protein
MWRRGGGFGGRQRWVLQCIGYASEESREEGNRGCGLLTEGQEEEASSSRR